MRLIPFIFLVLAACGPDVSISFGDEFGDDGAETGGPAAGDGLELDLPGDGCPDLDAFTCDGSGDCWTIVPGWSASAQYAHGVMIQAMLDASILSNTIDEMGIDGDCYDIIGSDSHVCVVYIDCAPLLVRPLAELDLEPSECAPGGPWTASTMVGDSSGTCWGALATVAVEIRP